MYFLVIQCRLHGKIHSIESSASILNYKKYDFMRSVVYAIEIVLMVTVQESWHFYKNLVHGDNWFICTLAVCLYIQILFWGGVMLLLSPWFLCTRRPAQDERRNNSSVLDD